MIVEEIFHIPKAEKIAACGRTWLLGQFQARATGQRENEENDRKGR
jgi:hypothetical protein